MPKDNDIIDLTKVLSQRVESSGDAHFTPQFDDVENVIVMDPEPEPAEEQAQPADDGGPTESLTPDDIAVITVNLVDGLQQFGFAIARKKMAFTQAELDLLPRLNPDDKQTIYPDNSPEGIAMRKLRKHLEVVKGLPFNNEEKKRLNSASIIYARTMNMKVSPLTGLMMAFGEVLTTRAMTVFSE